jgi:hypothetical protein
MTHDSFRCDGNTEAWKRGKRRRKRRREEEEGEGEEEEGGEREEKEEEEEDRRSRRRTRTSRRRSRRQRRRRRSRRSRSRRRSRRRERKMKRRRRIVLLPVLHNSPALRRSAKILAYSCDSALDLEMAVFLTEAWWRLRCSVRLVTRRWIFGALLLCFPVLESNSRR